MKQKNKVIEIDGSFGEGGGQILRTSLSLAALTGRVVHFRRIRAGRKKPGLMRQHLACAKAIAEISGGHLKFAELNSQEMIFSPGRIQAGNYRFPVGSAGSAILIAQTVLPCLLSAGGESHVVIEGGTHAPHAPIFEFFEKAYLPCLRRMGAEVTARLERIGFYPAGGGKLSLDIRPTTEWKPFELPERGAAKKARIVSLSHGIAEKIREDELRFCREILKRKEGFEEVSMEVDSPCPGNVMYAELEFERITELFSLCGELSISRKVVGERVAGMVNGYTANEIPVWRYLADQLLLPLAIGAGGMYRTFPPSLHTETNIAIIRKFLNVGIELEEKENKNYIITVKK